MNRVSRVVGFGGKMSLYQAIVHLPRVTCLWLSFLKVKYKIVLKMLTELIQIQIQVIYYSDQPIHKQYCH